MAKYQNKYSAATTNMYWQPPSKKSSNTGGGSNNSGSNGVGGSNLWMPNLQDSYEYGQEALNQYFENVSPYTPVGDLSAEIKDVGAYGGYDWQNPLDTYNAPSYQQADIYSYTDPLADYNPASYDALSEYSRPDFERTNYSDPSIDAINSIAPLSNELYEGQIAKSREQIAKQYQDTQQQVLDEVYRNKNRPEAAAALLAELGVQQNASQEASARDIRFQQANQELGIKQQEQALGLERSTNLANLTSATEQAQAAERQAAAQYNLGASQWEEGQRQYGYEKAAEEARYQAEQSQWYQQRKAEEAAARQAEGQYAYEQNVGEEKFKSGLAQWYQEQKAAEEQAKYQSRYAYAQDLGQARLNEYETNRAAQMDYNNALLQGQQAASGQFAQGATYATNLTKKERAGASQNTSNSSLYQLPKLGGTTYQNTTKYSLPRRNGYSTKIGGNYA